jgi:hypothetical protein
MTRDEMLERITSEELTVWMGLFKIQAGEAQHAHDIAESGDGIVHVSGLDDGSDDDEEEAENTDEE